MPVFLPARRLLIAIAAAAPLFVIGPRAGLAADLVILGLALVDIILAPGRSVIGVTRRVPARIGLGAEDELEIEVRSAWARDVELEITQDLPQALERLGDDVVSARVPARGWARIRTRVRAAERGRVVVGDLHLRALGPLGLVWRQWRVPLEDEIRVQPGLLEIKQHRLLGIHHRLQEVGGRNVRRVGERGSFESLADYNRGDDPRTIDWKATARRARLTVRRYEVERSQNLVLAIDAGRLMMERVGERDRFDHALAAALLLADLGLRGGDRVGTLAFSDRVEQYMPPGRVPLGDLADTLSLVEPRLVEPNYPAAFTYLGQRLRRRSLVVLFTDLIDARASAALLAHLAHAASRHLVLAVTLRNPELDEAALLKAGDEAGAYRRAAAEELLQLRAHALATMRRAGVIVADVRPEEALSAVVNRYLEVKRRGMI